MSIYIYTHHLLYPFICQWTLGCFHVLAIVNSAAMNTGVYVSFQIRVFIFSGYKGNVFLNNLFLF